MMKSILTTIAFLALAVSGSAQTRSVIVNTSGVVQSPTNFWSADAANARIGLGLGTAATNAASAFQPSSLVLSNLASSNGSALTNLTAANITGTVALASNITGTIAISNGGSGATTAGGARTNLGLGTTNNVQFNRVIAPFFQSTSSNAIIELDDDQFILTAAQAEFRQPIIFDNTTNAAATRTNLSLGWSALTNTSTSGFNTSLYGSGTNPVLYNTNGEVVSPTNFWQAAPINTVVQYSQPTGASNNVTNAATNARNLYLYSLTPLVNNVTNTITLPTNAATFFGDVATVIHEGPTNSSTAIRQIGSATNIISLNQFQEAVQFIYNGGGWKLADNISQVEPLYFSGTNAVAHAAASRTNLGLGSTNDVTFQQVTVNGNVINGSGFFYAGDVNVGLSFEEAWIQDFSSNSVLNWGNNTYLEIGRPINFGTNVATTRTNLGLGGGVTTNIDIKLNNNTGMRLYFTNGILTNTVPIP